MKSSYSRNFLYISASHLLKIKWKISTHPYHWNTMCFGYLPTGYILVLFFKSGNRFILDKFFLRVAFSFSDRCDIDRNRSSADRYVKNTGVWNLILIFYLYNFLISPIISMYSWSAIWYVYLRVWSLKRQGWPPIRFADRLVVPPLGISIRPSPTTLRGHEWWFIEGKGVRSLVMVLPKWDLGTKCD